MCVAPVRALWCALMGGEWHISRFGALGWINGVALKMLGFSVLIL